LIDLLSCRVFPFLKAGTVPQSKQLKYQPVIPDMYLCVLDKERYSSTILSSHQLKRLRVPGLKSQRTAESVSPERRGSIQFE